MLFNLPNEVLHVIIEHTLPESFESLALSCKFFYALSKPFLEHHNKLRSRFRNFTYRDKDAPRFRWQGIITAYDVIVRITAEPIVACYLRDVDFTLDSFFARHRHRHMVKDAHIRGDVAKLFANSSYLQQAGLDWKEYYASIQEDIEVGRYSQYAAAFLLTLLPNVEKLKLPAEWKYQETTDKLVDTIAYEAKQSRVLSVRPSLSQTTWFASPVGTISSGDSDWAHVFLNLPKVRCFYGDGLVRMNVDPGRLTSPELPQGLGETLIRAHFQRCYIHHGDISRFLKHTPRLRTLGYLHENQNENRSQCWDICKFVAAVERHAGTHLVELSVSIYELSGSIAPGKASIRGFQCLQRLQLPLELAQCNVTAATSCSDAPKEIGVESLSDNKMHSREAFIDDLVPASVSQLSLLSDGKSDHVKVLDVIFRCFTTRKDTQLPALEDVYLSCPKIGAEESYKTQCYKLLAEIEKTDTTLHLQEWSEAFLSTDDEA